MVGSASVFGTDTVNSGSCPAIRTSTEEGATSALIALAASDGAWIKARRGRRLDRRAEALGHLTGVLIGEGSGVGHARTDGIDIR